MRRIEEFRSRLEEAQETLEAIRRGEVDGVVVSTPKGQQIYTISGAEKPYRLLIEEMKEGAVMLSDDNTILYCNRGFAKMMKCSLEKLVGSNIESMVSPTFKVAFKELLAECRGVGKKNSLTKGITFISCDNALVPTQISVNSLNLDETNTTFIVVTDLTEHMENELKRYTSDLEKAGLALFESEQRWSTTLASIGDAVIATDLSSKITFMNAVAEKLTGWSLREASGKPVKEVFRIVNAQTHLEVENPITKVLKAGTIVGLANHTILIRRDKTEVFIGDSGAPIKNKEGKTTGVVLIFRDVTERKKAEDDLKKSKDLEYSRRIELEALMQTVPATIWISHDPECLNMTGNKATYDLLQLPRDSNVSETAPEQSRPTNFLAYGKDGKPIPFDNLPMQVAARKGEPVLNSEFEFRFIDGRSVWLYGNVTPLRNSKGKVLGAVGAFVDISQIKQLQQKLNEYTRNLEKLVEQRTRELQDKERLAVIGATAGMVGHDIRNPLQAITGDLYLAKSELTSLPDSFERKSALDSIEEIERNVDYINKIVADLQDFARPLHPAAQETDLKTVIEDLVLKSDLPENIKTQVKVDADAEKMVTDTSFISRILYNLVTNAVQAMPTGGELTIGACKEANDIVITVKDTGVGIPEAARDKLFTPLFTTKPKGQGFGLSVIKRMTEALGGTVTFESQEGKGTTFKIRLPPQKAKT